MDLNIFALAVGWMLAALMFLVWRIQAGMTQDADEQLDEMTVARDWWRTEYHALKALLDERRVADQKWSLDWPKLVDPQPADDALAQQECEASNEVSPRWTVHGVGP